MNAAQVCSILQPALHLASHTLEENQAAADAARHAVNNPECDCIGVGMTQYNGITYCYVFVGIPDSVNFYTQQGTYTYYVKLKTRGRMWFEPHPVKRIKNKYKDFLQPGRYAALWQLKIPEACNAGLRNLRFCQAAR